MKSILLSAVLLIAITNAGAQSNNQKILEQRLSIVTLGVNDLKASVEFYTKKFGWKLIETSNDNISFLQLNGIQLALYGRKALAEDVNVNEAGSGFRSFTLAYAARSEKEVDEIIKALREKGVRILKEPQKVFWGGYSSYISDPDGNIWEIAFNPYLHVDDQGNIK